MFTPFGPGGAYGWRWCSGRHCGDAQRRESGRSHIRVESENRRTEWEYPAVGCGDRTFLWPGRSGRSCSSYGDTQFGRGHIAGNFHCIYFYGRLADDGSSCGHYTVSPVICFYLLAHNGDVCQPAFNGSYWFWDHYRRSGSDGGGNIRCPRPKSERGGNARIQQDVKNGPDPKYSQRKGQSCLFF